MFNHISSNATRKGLKVNASKTTLLVMSSASSYRARSHIYNDSNQRIDSTESLKALGFIFNEQADVSNQIESLCKRFRSRTWALRDLRKAGLDQADLLRVYKTTIRPVIEYSSVIFQLMLTKE